MKLNLKTNILLFLVIFTVTIVTIGVSTTVMVHTKVIAAAHEKLKGDLAMGRALGS